MCSILDAGCSIPDKGENARDRTASAAIFTLGEPKPKKLKIEYCRLKIGDTPLLCMQAFR
jgi:hypothetical protein